MIVRESVQYLTWKTVDKSRQWKKHRENVHSDCKISSQSSIVAKTLNVFKQTWCCMSQNNNKNTMHARLLKEYRIKRKQNKQVRQQDAYQANAGKSSYNYVQHPLTGNTSSLVACLSIQSTQWAENDVSARLPNITSASCLLDIWPHDDWRVKFASQIVSYRQNPEYYVSSTQLERVDEMNDLGILLHNFQLPTRSSSLLDRNYSAAFCLAILYDFEWTNDLTTTTK